MCSFKLLPCVNDLLHTVQGKWFSPESVLMYFIKCSPTVKDLVHTVHGKVFLFNVFSYVVLNFHPV